MTDIVHLLSGLQIGGKERAALRLARRAMRDGRGATLVLYDTPFRSAELDFDPGEVPTILLKRGPGVDLRFAWRLARQLRELGARVVHAHNDTALFYAALAATLALPCRVRVVASFHAWPSQGSRGARWLTRLAGMRAGVAAVSDDLAGLLRGAGWLGKCGVIRNGVDINHYTPAGPTDGWRGRLSVAEGDFLVGHVARFDPIKRHLDLLEAAARLAEERARIVFVLVGQGPLLDEMRRRAAGLDNVHFVAQVTDMPPLLRSLDAITLCSDHEATPLALLEGMACGVPVVATAVGGVPDLLGDAGLLVPPRDPGEMARTLATLAADPALRTRLAKTARRRALEFPFEAEWAAYARLYAGDAEYFSRLGRCFRMRSSRSQ